MRRGFMTFVVAGMFALWGSIALAQSDPIQLIVGPPQDVAGGPQFAAVGDLDGDGYADAVVSTERDEQVTSLISAGDGSIKTPITFPVGRRIGDIALGDFNADQILDIAVIDERGGVFTISGIGDGRFNGPVFHEGTRRSEAVAIADIDRRNGPDIITANGTDNTISVFLNRGQNRGFERSIEYSVGGDSRPDDIEVADINGDGFPDVIVSDSDLRDIDEVTVMINNGLAQFLQVFNFIVDDGSTSITIGDYNDDGKVDIASINVGDLRTTVRRSYTISLLLGNGAGIFNVQPPVEFPCPAQYNGNPIVCFPQDIVTADFNKDGYDDLAASIEIRTEQDIGVETPGIIDAMVSLGDGSFQLSTTVQVGLRPRGLGVGDMTGDGVSDLAVTEYGRIGIRDTGDTVTIVRGVPIPPRPDGSVCRNPDQCASNVCLNGFCCEKVCPGFQRCDIPGHEGTCTDPGDNGDACTDGTQCTSGFCVDGFCCGTRNCPEGQFCNTGACGPPAPPGTPCNDGEQCASGNCVDGVCCTAESCPVGERCDIPGKEGTCNSTLPDGEACEEDGQCVSGHCTDGFCCNVDECAEGQSCGVAGREGLCTVLPTATPTATPTPTPQPNGFPCGSNQNCTSGYCVDDTCCSTAFCPPNQFCDIAGSEGTCAPRKPQGAGCNEDSDCQSNNCELNNPNTPQGYAGICAPVRTPTPIGPGGRCGETADCQPGFFCNEKDGFICCNELECPANQTCRDPSNPGFCTLLPTPTPTRLPNGSRCSANNPEVCSSGNCINSTCCEQAGCSGTDRCDVFGFEGQCVPPLPEGAPCNKNSDCEGELQCRDLDGNGLQCVVPPITPTRPPTPIPTSTPAATVKTSRSGGCAIDGSGSDANGAWLLSLLPLAVWVRRRNQA